jgi:hypothetical protein
MDEHPSITVAIISGDLNWDDERRTGGGTRTVSTTDPVLLSSIPEHWKDTWLEATQPPSVPISNNNTTTTTTTTTTTKAKKQKTTATSNSLVEGYTYDSKLNPMLSGSLRRRFDRVLVHSNPFHNHSVQILAPQLLGTNVISPDLTWEKYNMYTRTTRIVPTAPSDHFGYIVTLQI